MSLRIALVAGEASGDLLGAALVRDLKQRHPEAEFVGVGVSPFFDDGRQNFGAGPTCPAAEEREFIEDVEGRNVTARKFVVQTGKKMAPPVRSEVGHPAERMVAAQMRLLHREWAMVSSCSMLTHGCVMHHPMRCRQCIVSASAPTLSGRHWQSLVSLRLLLVMHSRDLNQSSKNSNRRQT